MMLLPFAANVGVPRLLLVPSLMLLGMVVDAKHASSGCRVRAGVGVGAGEDPGAAAGFGEGDGRSSGGGS